MNYKTSENGLNMENTLNSVNAKDTQNELNNAGNPLVEESKNRQDTEELDFSRSPAVIE